MKNLFALNSQDEEKSVYKRFVTKTLDESFEQKINEVADYEKTINKKVFGKYQAIYKICSILMFAAIIGIFILLTRVSKEENLGLPWWIILSCTIILGVVCGVMIFVIKKKANKISENNEDIKNFNQKSEEVFNEIIDFMEIPEDCVHLDVYCIGIEEKKDGSLKEKGIMGNAYLNVDTSIYLRENVLNISTLHEIITLDTSWIKQVIYLPARVSFYGWNKNLAPNSVEYRNYKIKANNYGIYFIKGSYQIQFNDGFEDYLINVPVYEKDTLLKFIPEELFINTFKDEKNDL